ncbi:acetyl-CoA hydrolase/transferase C-terminal domain-containing protein [Parahaliea aestuarii]|uniref:Acetyl-CoA hydrolase n=1 Tax=Parahaliea aestuarii TaxID=1852021 RepID=A0A5C8ZUE1_9GAMM|nr:acetyl-CoA hydrolase/transferase C-terminal domain-containing protein [Parahaliea aestuarii]TXS91077.1 acetyl-CoA hydrolase [Parahaliea aestuarii]
MSDTGRATALIESVEDCVDRALARVGRQLVLAVPLGLGKPVQLVNAFYRRAAADPGISLHILTALSLERPEVPPGLAGRLAGPVIERIYGDYEELAYMAPLRAGELPENIRISEFYFRAGAMKSVAEAQRHYISSNYTHVARDLVGHGVNVIAQLVARRDGEISLSCNPDLTLHMARMLAEAGRPCIHLGQVHPELPFMGGDARVAPDFFDVLVAGPDCGRRLFSAPNGQVPLADYAAAIHASSLIADNGTLQIGIGALGDAVAQACILRQRENATYQRLLAGLETLPSPVQQYRGGFDKGLYVSTEMFVSGMLALIEAGIVKRRVYDDLLLQEGLNEGAIGGIVDEQLLLWLRQCEALPARLGEGDLAWLRHWGIVGDSVTLAEGDLYCAGERLDNDIDQHAVRRVLLEQNRGMPLRHGNLLHAGFFLGPRDFYQRLRELEPAVAESLCMTWVGRTNQLLENAPLYRAQRRRARFINTGMMATLSGAVVSDALEDGTVISGVGGQYNFVAMAHDLPDARSILCIRSTRRDGRRLHSNIVPRYGHTTIPRHLRDIVVTEYGIADLRGQDDGEVMKRLIQVADSRFQGELLQAAVASGKVEADYRLPESCLNNTPQRLAAALEPFRRDGWLPDYPFGSDLTRVEQGLADCLKVLDGMRQQPREWPGLLWRALRHKPTAAAADYLQRLQLAPPANVGEGLLGRVLSSLLQERGWLQGDSRVAGGDF